MTTYTPREDLAVKPLSATERRWLEELDELLKRMPKRLLLVECGDSLFVADRQAAMNTELHDGKARAAGIVLADLDNSIGAVTGVSG